MEFELKEYFDASPEEIYAAWLDSESHAAMTGAPASASNKVGGSFSAWDGYISGRNKHLEAPNLIIQKWRTTQFAEGQSDSEVKIDLEEENGGSLLTLTHSNLKEGDEHYKQGWIDHYFTPMKDYF